MGFYVISLINFLPMSSALKLSKFNDNVVSKYQIYNSIFMTLPFDSISNTGVLLPLFHEVCKKGFSLGFSRKVL